jgi:hypothetical protein
MADEADYADRLRETLLALALVPLAGLATAAFWARESLDRTSRLGGDVVASTALARFTRARSADGRPDPAAEVLALDLLEAARTYVRAMVRLPADAGVYFTGELEQRFNALLERIRPEPDKNLTAFADAELQQLSQEVDRLLVIARTEASRPAPAAAAPRRAGYRRAAYERAARQQALEQWAADTQTARTLVASLEKLRALVRATRPQAGQRIRAGLVLDAPPPERAERFATARARTRARVRLQEALREAERLVPTKKKALKRLDTLINERIPVGRRRALAK